MKAKLQLFGGRGGGSGLSGGGGSSASGQYGDRNAPAAQQYRRDLADMANANMSNSDLQAAVEAYAMTHPGIDEETMLRNVREYRDLANHPDNLSPAARNMVEDAGLKLKEITQTSVKAPKDITSGVISTMKVREAASNAGLQRASSEDLSNMAVGTKVVVSSPVMKYKTSSRRDPDGVHFETGTFAGFQNNAFRRPLVTLSDGKKHAIETDMPYEGIYRRK